MPSSTPSSHRQKRAFLPSNQTSLDTFFRNAPSSESSSPGQVVSDREGLAPALPASIQSNLLTVGMRVRKSVPEGYKTHKLGFHDVRSTDVRLPDAPSTVSAARPAELQPYCGLLNVGGYGPQERTYSTSGLGSDYIPVDASGVNLQSADPLDFPFSSQESNISSASNLSTDSMPARNPILQPSFSNANANMNTTKRSSKRALQVDDDEDLGLPFPQPQTHSSRAFARPKLGRRRSPRLAQQQSTLHSFNFTPPPNDGVDFEEATFFKADDWKDNDMDTENDI
ncbi:hypothetical protein EJ05DRAFT_48852 [Pseudovirgaria hyperparasitica]|uniref:Uncharacterized protein n=1 Tax=Pseudovirgaria hyperparasitica TaxID=470096 RepID=A0A6A6W207_9PEZI|nr:uncharacterized protein EJ05DRAFT_48852 [Pseudovirgaria hyperparasitica]KAF2756958.1 hypothetical protein EJ05DRAFT_48852 [Pseudovirgaria hyperparasitica]